MTIDIMTKTLVLAVAFCATASTVYGQQLEREKNVAAKGHNYRLTVERGVSGDVSDQLPIASVAYLCPSPAIANAILLNLSDGRDVLRSDLTGARSVIGTLSGTDGYLYQVTTRVDVRDSECQFDFHLERILKFE